MFDMQYACRVIQYPIEAYSTAIILMHVFQRLCACVHALSCHCCVCEALYSMLPNEKCKCDCATCSVCFSVCADRQLLLRTFKCLLIAAIT